MLDDAPYVLVVGVVRVDEGRLLRGVVVVLVLVLLGLSNLKYFSVTEKYFNVLRALSPPRWPAGPGRRSGRRWGCAHRQGF